MLHNVKYSLVSWIVHYLEIIELLVIDSHVVTNQNIRDNYINTLPIP